METWVNSPFEIIGICWVRPRKAHFQSVRFLSVPLVCGKTCFCRLCAGYQKTAVLTGYIHVRNLIQEFFTTAESHLWVDHRDNS